MQSLLSDFPDPFGVEVQRAVHLHDVDWEVRRCEALLAHKHAAALEYVRARCEKQKEHLCYTIEQRVQMQELQANARCSDMQHRLAAEAARRRLDAERRAHAAELGLRATKMLHDQVLAEGRGAHSQIFERPGPHASSDGLAHSGPSHHVSAASEPSGAGLLTSSGALAQTLHVIVHAVYGVGAAPGAATDMYATAQVGGQRQQTGPARVAADPSSPIWERDNHFAFLLGRQDFLLDVEVRGRTALHEGPVGRASWDLRGAPLGQWRRLRERLHGSGGEVELDVCLLAAPGHPQHQGHAHTAPLPQSACPAPLRGHPHGALEQLPPMQCHPPGSPLPAHQPPERLHPRQTPSSDHRPGHTPRGQRGHGSHGSSLQVIIHGARNLLNKDTGIWGDYSDPFVECRVGAQKQRTPTVNNNLNPVWSQDNQFTFQIGPQDAKLELEVFNHNMIVNQTLGKTGMDLHGLRPGEMRRFQQPLVNGGRGELDFSVCLAATQQPVDGDSQPHFPVSSGHVPLSPHAAASRMSAPPPGGFAAPPSGGYYSAGSPCGCSGCPMQTGGFAPPPTGCAPPAAVCAPLAVDSPPPMGCRPAATRPAPLPAGRGPAGCSAPAADFVPPPMSCWPAATSSVPPDIGGGGSLEAAIGPPPTSGGQGPPPPDNLAQADTGAHGPSGHPAAELGRRQGPLTGSMPSPLPPPRGCKVPPAAGFVPPPMGSGPPVTGCGATPLGDPRPTDRLQETGIGTHGSGGHSGRQPSPLQGPPERPAHSPTERVATVPGPQKQGPLPVQPHPGWMQPAGMMPQVPPGSMPPAGAAPQVQQGALPHGCGGQTTPQAPQGGTMQEVPQWPLPHGSEGYPELKPQFASGQYHGIPGGGGTFSTQVPFSSYASSPDTGSYA